MTTLLPRAVLAILGILALEGVHQRAFANGTESRVGSALECRQEPPASAAPTPPDSFVSVTPAPFRPCLPVVVGPSSESASEASLRLHACPEEARRAVLVAAQILKKYLHFRESLTSP